MLLFSLFVFVAYIFHSRTRKQPTEASHRPEIQWEAMLFVLYGVSGLIMLRNIFRVVETAGGRDGYLLSHEWPLYFFDYYPYGGSGGCSTLLLPCPDPPMSYGMENVEAQLVRGHRRR